MPYGLYSQLQKREEAGNELLCAEHSGIVWADKIRQNMKPVSCCVPLCTNNFRNSSNLSFLPDPERQKLTEEICGIDSKQ